MKTTFRFIIAAMAAIAVFSSCQKELANETANNTTDGVRVISVQFDNSTKATLSGVTPTFTNEDKIRVSNTEKSEECKVSVDGSGNATFTTTLSGELTAIYPEAAADYTGSGPISSQAFKVLATQTGKVEDAIIAKATIASNSATFTGVTALFEITPPSGATSITITSLNKIDAATGRRSATANAATINTTGEDDAAKRKITVGVVGDKAYVSLVPGVNLTDLSFDAGETYGMKGIPASKITGGLVDETAANKKYTIGNSDNTWHPYVTIGGKKWATMNVGATDTDPYGTYFMWGETTGITRSGSTFSFPDAKYYSAGNNSWDQTVCFAWANCPWTNDVYNSPNKKNVFTKYIPSDQSVYWGGSDSPDNKTTLDLADDAAYANWGGPWRMPTGGTDANSDFTALAKAAKSNYSSGSISPSSQEEVPTSQGVFYYNVDGSKGLYFVDESGNKLFFLAAGYGDGTSLSYEGSRGRYCSSSLNTGSPYDAYSLRFSSSSVDPQGLNYRCIGFSVRPVSD